MNRVRLTRAEAEVHAARLHVSARTIYKLAKRGVDPSQPGELAAYLIKTPRAAKRMAVPFLTSLSEL